MNNLFKQLLHVSGAHLLETTLGSQAKRKDVVPDCGHAMYAEEPHTLAGLITSFQVLYIYLRIYNNVQGGLLKFYVIYKIS